MFNNVKRCQDAKCFSFTSICFSFFSQVYMINLKRRPLRRQRMLASLEQLGMKVKVLDAVDGK